MLREWPVALALIAAAYTATLYDGYADSLGHDETFYAERGASLTTDGFVAVQMGPAYQAWYWVQSLTNPDNVYRLNFALLAFAVPLALYGAVRAMRGSVAGAAAVALGYLATSMPLVWPRVSHFALLCVLLGICASAIVRRASDKLAVTSLGLLVASYARPNELVAYFVVLGISLVLGLRERAAKLPIAAGVIGAAALAAFGSPLWTGDAETPGGDRSMWAFAQHYAVNVYRVEGRDGNPWLEWGPLIRETFGDAETVGECARANPRAFLWHVGENVQAIPRSLFQITSIRWLHALPVRIAAFIACAATFVVVVLFTRNRWRGSPNAAVAITLCVGLTASGIPAVLVVAPRWHYLLLPIAVVTACAMALSTSRRHEVDEHQNTS